MRIIDYALAPDGGTQIVVLERDNGEQISIGLDGRMGVPGSGLQLFVGNSPDSPDTRMLPIGGEEESMVIELLDRWLDETQGFLRRESLMDSDPSALKGQDLLDRMALQLLLEIRARDISEQR